MVMQLVLDMGSGNTCQNDKSIVKEMIDNIVSIDIHHYDIVFKWQLFNKSIDGNIPLDREVFEYAYRYADIHGYMTTSSVFDKDSLLYLLGFDIPFVKFSCNTVFDEFVEILPHGMDVYKSVFDNKLKSLNNIKFLWCIPKYPASSDEYFDFIGPCVDNLFYFISDHTCNWDVYNRYKPLIYECHYKLPNSKGKDAGVWARTPEQLKEIMLL